MLDKKGLEAETKELQGFYDSVRERAKGIDNAAGKQKIMLELYDKFFATAFKKDSERLGIVYTPVEVVDFILASADVALKKEFGKGLSDKDVHILDPFTGTGTFIARLLQSDIIENKDLKRKYATNYTPTKLCYWPITLPPLTLKKYTTTAAVKIIKPLTALC